MRIKVDRKILGVRYMTSQQILNELIDAGLSLQDIADFCGSSQPTINRALNGSAASRYELSKEIEKLHRRKMRALARKIA